MGRKYHGEFYGLDGALYRVEFWDSATADDPDSSIQVAIKDCKVERQGEGDKYYENPIRSSRMSVTWTNYRTAGLQYSQTTKEYFERLSIQPEQKYTMILFKSNTLHWIGRVLADQSGYKYQDHIAFEATIIAVDALNLLKGYEVDPDWFEGVVDGSGNTTTPRITLLDLIVNILAKANLYQFWDTLGYQDYIYDCIEHTNANKTTPYGLDYMQTDVTNWVLGYDIRKDSSELNYVDCKVALQDILEAFGARITHDRGGYWITQANSYDTGTTLEYDRYDNAGDPIASNESFSHRHTVTGSAPRPVWGQAPIISYQPPVRGAKIAIRKTNGITVIKGGFNKSAFSDTVTIRSGAPIKIRFEIDTEAYTFAGVAPQFNGRILFKFHHWVKNSSTNDYVLWNKYTSKWESFGTSLPGVKYTFITHEIPISDWSNPHHSFIKELPPPPSGYDRLYCEVDCEFVKPKTAIYNTNNQTWLIDWTSYTLYDINFSGRYIVIQGYGSTEPYQYEKYQYYETMQTSDRLLNSEIVEKEITLYNGNLNDAGNIYVWNGTIWVDSAAWTVGWTANTGDLPQVLARQIVGLYRDFVQTIRGVLHDDGNYNTIRSIYFEPEAGFGETGTYIFNGGTWDVAQSTWDAEWLRVDLDYTNVNDGDDDLVYIPKDPFIDVYDKLDNLLGQQSLNKAFISDIGPHVKTNVLNEGLNTPTDEPSQDTVWDVQLAYTYDSAAPTLDWRVRTSPGDFDITSIANGDILVYNSTSGMWENQAPGASSYAYTLVSKNNSDSPYTITDLSGDIYIEFDCSGGNSTVNLPTLASSTARYNIKMINSTIETLTIDGNGSETIDGATTYVLITNNEAVTIIKGSGGWLVY